MLLGVGKHDEQKRKDEKFYQEDMRMRDIPLARQDMRFIQYFQAEDDPNVIIGYENPYRTERARCISVEDFYFEYLYGMAHSALTEGIMCGTVKVGRTTRRVITPSSAVVADMMLVKIEAAAEGTREFRIDAIIKAKILISMVKDGQYTEDTVEQWFRVPFILNITTYDRSFMQLPIAVYDKNARATGRALDNYLVPIIRNNELENVATQLLSKYYPEALEKPMRLDVKLLASRMGFEIQYATITKNHSILGQFYFDDENALVYNATADSFTRRAIRANTMLIDLEAATIHGIPHDADTITHECIHGYLDYFAYRLQKAYNEDMNCLSCSREIVSDGEEGKPMRVIEARTAKLTPRVRMPALQTKMKIDELLVRHSIDIRHALQNERQARSMENVITELAAFYGVSKKAAKLRMMELGYERAKGVLNYVNGAYTPWYNTASMMLEWNQTFTISVQDAATEYIENPRFAALIDTGRYQYVEGHFCIRDAAYVAFDSNGNARLTDYARSHIDECCLTFVVQNHRPTRQHSEGLFLREEASILTNIGLAAASITQNVELSATQCLALIKEAHKINQIRVSLPSRFTDTLTLHMKRLNITREKLEERSGLSIRTITRMRNDECFAKTMRQVVALCIGMNLEPELSTDLIGKSGQQFMQTDEHALYSLLLRTMYSCSIFVCDAILQKAGITPLMKDK